MSVTPSKKSASGNDRPGKTALRKTEQQLLLHFRQTAVAVIEWNLNFEVKEWNPAAERIFGFSRAEAIGRHAIGLLVPESARPHVNQIWSDLLSKRGGTRSTNENITKGGRTILCEWYNTPLVDEDERVVGVASIAQDVTERHQAEAALRQSEARKAAILESALDCIITMDHEGRIVEFNPAAESTFGYSRDEVIGQLLANKVIPPALRAQHAFGMTRYLTTGASTMLGRCVEMTGMRASGELFPVELTITRIPIDGPPLFTGVIRDITERVRAEQALRESEERLRTVITAAPIILWAMDAQGIITLSAGKGLAALGLKPGEVVGRSVFELYRDHAQIQRDHRRALAGESLTSLVEVEGVVFESRLNPLRDSEGRVVGVIGVATDITERIQAEEALRESGRFQQLMLSELDHRVRNNLASLESLIDISARDQANVREFASSIKGRVQAMASVHSLLSKSHWMSVSLQELIDALTPAAMRQAFGLDGPDVIVNPRQVTALGMIFQELMANSLKYGSLSVPRGRVSIAWHFTGTERPERDLTMHWSEEGGPRIDATPVEGQGSKLIAGLLRTDLGGRGELTYPPEGVRHSLVIRLDQAMRLADPEGATITLRESN